MINIESELIFDLRMLLQSAKSGIELSRCDTATKWLRDVREQAMEIRGRIQELEDERDFLRNVLKKQIKRLPAEPDTDDMIGCIKTNFDCGDGVQTNH